jgi:hypothetical protein
VSNSKLQTFTYTAHVHACGGVVTPCRISLSARDIFIYAALIDTTHRCADKKIALGGAGLPPPGGPGGDINQALSPQPPPPATRTGLMTGAAQSKGPVCGCNHGCFNTQARARETPIALCGRSLTPRVARVWPRLLRGGAIRTADPLMIRWSMHSTGQSEVRMCRSQVDH